MWNYFMDARECEPIVTRRSAELAPPAPACLLQPKHESAFACLLRFLYFVRYAHCSEK